MKQLLPLLVTFLFLATSGHTQSTYYGHKVGVSLNFIGRKPLLAKGIMSFLDDYNTPNIRYRNSRPEEYRNFDWGFETGITFFSRKQASFGLQFTYYKTDMIRYESNYYYDAETSTYFTATAFEDLSFNSMTFMPVISVTSEDLIKPIGLTHEFGLGYMSSSIVDKDYHFKMDGTVVQDTSGIFYDRNAKYQGVCAMYGLKLAKPLTKSLAMNFGFRYTLNFGNKDNTNPGKNLYELDNDAKNGLNKNYVNLVFGLTLLI